MQFRTVRALIIGNFILFVALTFALGGDAINGRRAAGRYFLGSHGRFTEVSQATYVYSFAHTLLTILSIVIFVAATLLLRRKRTPGV